MLTHHRRVGLLLAAVLTTACATVPEYQPRTPGSTVGYRDVQLSPNRYRVTYSGSYDSTRDDVETYLLRRAAEVTLLNGYTHFVIQKRETHATPDYAANRYGFYPYGYYPYSGYGGYAPSYSSYAEIMLLKGPETANAANVVDAQRVLVSLNDLPPSTVKTAAAPE